MSKTKMKIVLVIDSLGAGGAQRQMVGLAVGLKRAGFDVTVIFYKKLYHFKSVLDDACIPFTVIQGGKWTRVWKIGQSINSSRPEVVVAFLEGPSFYSELVKVFFRSSWKLIVGERLADPSILRVKGRCIRILHRISDAIVCNSWTNLHLLSLIDKDLGLKSNVIYNVVDTNFFHPRIRVKRSSDITVIGVAASYQHKKNMLGLVRALGLVLEKLGFCPFRVHWHGHSDSSDGSLEKCKKEAIDLGVSQYFYWGEVLDDVIVLYEKIDILALVSYYEGLPNAVCEGLACGIPVLISDVCDAGSLVEEGLDGFVVDPSDPNSIAEKLLKFRSLSAKTVDEMGFNARKRAERMFTEDQFILSYTSVIRSLFGDVDNFKLNSGISPESAQRTVESWTKDGFAS